MPEAENSVVIGRPLHEVFAFLADAENDARWRPGVIEIRRLSGAGEGTRYHQVVSGPGGRRISADIEITDYVPDRLIGFRATSGPVRPSGRYEVAEDGSGTRVGFRLEAELSGVKRLVFGSMVEKTMRSEVAALAELKRVLEEGATTS